MGFKSYLKESSLSRVWKHNEEHDCGALTAFRTARDCGEGEVYTHDENKKRNKKLLAQFKTLGYSVTKLQGVYPEGGQTKKESSFFIVDIQDKGMLKKDLMRMGEEYEQDSILFIPKGSIQGKAKAYLIGTNHCENNWLGYGKTEEFENGKLGYSSEIYTSKVNGRPFIFEEVGNEVMFQSGFDSILVDKVSKKNWEDIDI